MRELVQTSAFLGAFITVGTFELARVIRKKWDFALFNPMLLGIIFSIILLLVFRIDYDDYLRGANYITFLLTPATVCFAVPLYEKFELLKKNALAVVLGISAGMLASLCSIFALCLLFGFDYTMFVTLLPKSITVAIASEVTAEYGGYTALTVVAITVTGLLGNVFAKEACRIFRIADPVAQGVAIGTCSHALGTSRALEIGEVQGAMSSLSLVVAGVLTVILASPAAALYEMIA